jgi:hypothetical protein
MANPHISITDELDNKVRTYAEEHNLRYSHVVSKLLEKALKEIEMDKKFDSIIRLLRKTNFNTKYNAELFEQLYSDLGLELSSNPKTNEYIKKFKNKYKKDYYSD